MLYPNLWIVQTFKLPNASAYLHVVELYLMKNGTIDSLFIGIYEWNTTSARLGKKLYSQNYTTLPTSFTIKQFEFSRGVLLKKDVQYALLLIANGIRDANNFNHIALKENNVDNAYPDGQRYASDNYGQTWVGYSTQDLYFVLYGSWAIDPVAMIVPFIPVLVLIALLGTAIVMMQRLSKG